MPQEAVGSVWKDVDGILKRAVETVNDKSNVIDVLDGVFDGTYVLWVVGGTQMKEWEDQLIDTMKRYANELGCSHLEGYGRKGWGRALKKYGFYPEYIAYRMEL